jgi:hypothetical protein
MHSIAHDQLAGPVADLHRQGPASHAGPSWAVAGLKPAAKRTPLADPRVKARPSAQGGTTDNAGAARTASAAS